MHATIQLVEYWGVAFLTLGLAVVLLNIYFGVIGNDLQLRTLGQEIAIAGFASFVEAGGLWLIRTYAPLALRAMIIPALIVAVTYKIAHLEDWSRYDVFMLLLFQIVITFAGTSLLYGHFESAIIILLCFAFFLAVIGSFLRDL